MHTLCLKHAYRVLKLGQKKTRVPKKHHQEKCLKISGLGLATFEGLPERFWRFQSSLFSVPDRYQKPI